MASGDVVFESPPSGSGADGFSATYYAKPVLVEDYAWEVHLKNEDAFAPQAEVVIKANVLGGVFPAFTSGKQYKIKITEV
jgi:hypothetical protein